MESSSPLSTLIPKVWQVDGGLGLSWGLILALIVVLVILVIMAGVFGAKANKEHMHDKMLHAINGGPSLRHQAELSDYSQPQPHVPRHSYYPAHQGYKTSRVQRGYEQFTGTMNPPVFNGPDMTQMDEMRLASQAMQPGSSGLMTRDYDASYYPNTAPVVGPRAGNITSSSSTGYITEGALNQHLLA
jgi:hypothetical protein